MEFSAGAPQIYTKCQDGGQGSGVPTILLVALP